ncbi:MAG: U32 family peptidase [Ruminococcus sp.]|nr:U32 family peptidase [Ruminococcus sp.]
MRARFHLPDFAQHFMFNLIFADMLKHRPELFREGVEIASVYGTFPPAIWNGGRFASGKCDKGFIKQVIKSFNDIGIPLRFTFTNPVLEKKHVHDEYCNMIMHLADNGMNEVIVASPILEEYIRKTYPNYKITSSTCKRITEPEKLYEEVDKDYHIVVIDYDLNNHFDILEKIPDKQKCELLVNACCNPGCKLRSDHYKMIGAETLAYAEHMKKTNSPTFDFKLSSKYAEYIKDEIIECKCMDRSVFQIKNLRTHISPDAIWEKYIPMGFEQFKIEGRTIELFNLVEHYMYYMIKPECRDEARLLFLTHLKNENVIQARF